MPGFRTAIPGAYQSVHGHWTVPLSYETCLLLQQKYGKRLKVGTELQRWATGVKSAREQMSRLAAASDTELENLQESAPFLYKAMSNRTYQKVGARFIAEGTGTLVSDDPGLGKTLIAMGGILEADIKGPYLIIAPKTAARPVWWREIRRFLPRWHKPIVFPEGRMARERKLKTTKFDEDTWVIVHPEMVMVYTYLECSKCKHHTLYSNKVKSKQTLECGHQKTRKTKWIDVPNYPKLFKGRWGAIVIDESHESLIVRRGVPTYRRNGMDKLKLRPDGLKIAMSGTPMKNKPHQLWGTLNWLDPVTYSAFHRWAELYWKKGGYTGYDIGEFIEERETILWDSLSTVCLRRTKAEVAQDLPAKIEVGSPLDPSIEDSPIGIWLELSGKQAKAYNQMAKDSAAQLKSGRLEAITALAELTRLKQLASSYGDMRIKRLASGEYDYKFIPTLPSNKFQWVIETLEEWGYPKDPIDKVVFVSNYTGLLRMFMQQIEKHFKTKPNNPLCSSITGMISAAKRAQAIKRFNQDDNEHLMFLNLKAGGTAITIDNASRTVFLTETRIPDEQLQAEDRTHRVSNPRQCMYYYLRSLGTVDVGTAIANIELANNSYRLLDARRGVDYLRWVIDHSNY